MVDPGFPRGEGANLQGGGANLLFGQKFPENCMKIKEFGPGGERVPGCPLRSANEKRKIRKQMDYSFCQVKKNLTEKNVGRLSN